MRICIIAHHIPLNDTVVAAASCFLQCSAGITWLIFFMCTLCTSCIQTGTIAVKHHPLYNSPAPALSFIKKHDSALFFAIEKNVKTIDYSTSDTERSYPFYDTIYISPLALQRGKIYTASVIFHEVCHIIFQKMRNKGKSIVTVGEYTALMEYGLDLDIIDALLLDRGLEEKIVHSMQLSFLKKFGSEADIKYQEHRIKNLLKTYKK